MGRKVYLPTFFVDFNGFHVGKYTFRPMESMDVDIPIWFADVK